MLSILIPLYQTKVDDLIKSVLLQLDALPGEHEVLISDVSPDPCFYPDKSGQTKTKLSYYHHKEVLSRARNRNYLAEKASNPYLIFIDADAIIPQTDFFSNYYERIQTDHVICGGTEYQQEKPQDKNRLLRWVYGRRREVKSAVERAGHPYESFSSFNFLIPKAIFQSIRFNTEFQQYGHEDTYFGYQLKKKNIDLLHIDNPLIHNGLDLAEDFLEKTSQGVSGIVELHQSENLPDEFFHTIRLWKTWQKLKKHGISGIVRGIAPLILFIGKKNLLSANPSVRLFDLYKIALISQIQH